MTSKSFYYCGHCDKVVGWKFGAPPNETLYCFACEVVVDEKERVRQLELLRYRAAVSHS